MEIDFLKDSFSLEGKIALVTGSSHGLGLVFARGLARAGATVILNGRDGKRLNEAVASLQEKGLSAGGRRFDVTNAREVKASIERIEKEFGPLSILVNNAGINRRRSLEEFAEKVLVH